LQEFCLPAIHFSAACQFWLQVSWGAWVAVSNDMATHRRDIDGLRAIAVAGVILDHAGVAGFEAGFAGVDIFFVISGFLIGGIVLKAMSENRFTFAEFYARRARRILPALLVMILVTLPFGWFLMTPNELRYHGGGAFATLAFLSNVWFLTRIDYFNPEVATDPLLHTWSLAVEEQFYVILPILLIVLSRIVMTRRTIGGVLAVLALVSFGLTVAATPADAMVVFYLGHTRAWELLAGVLASMVWVRAQSVPGVWRGVLAAVGLGLALISITLIPAHGLWPGFWTLAPVLGAVLVLLFGDQPSVARRCLSLAPMVWLGAISYSAYLWHQPILGFLEIADYQLRGFGEIFLYLFVTLVLAWASWRFIEQPFRKQKLHRKTARRTIWAMTAAILVFAVGGHVTDGYKGRLPIDVQQMLNAELERPPSFERCIGSRKEYGAITPETACVYGANVPPSIVLWGDSHAGVLVDALDKHLLNQGHAMRGFLVAGCPPVPGLESPRVPEYVICEDHNDRMFEYILKDPAIKLVILHGYWNYNTQRFDYENGAGDVKTDYAYLIKAGSNKDQSDDQRFAELTEVVTNEISALRAAGKQVIVVGPVPDPGFDVLDRLAMRYWKTDSPGAPMTTPAKPALEYGAPALAILSSAAQASGATWIDLTSLFCKQDDVCTFTEGGKALYFDDNHLALAGVAKVMPVLIPAIEAALTK
jgi:peptidoglycan/LPS O-acetylase OafA/YrhL